MLLENSKNQTARTVVLLATYNGAKYIREFLDSLVAQTYTNFKLIIRDDGSTDDTLEIIRSYLTRINIEYVVSNARLGPAKSFFELLAKTDDSFDFYFFADQDDYWYRTKIERAITTLSPTKEQVVLYCSRKEYVDENLAHMKYSKIPKVISLENALVENIATGCTIAITRSARELLLENLPNRIIMHDWWFYIVIVSFGKVIYDTFPSIKYRQHDNNTMGAATNIYQDFNRRLIRFIRKNDDIFLPAMQTVEFKRCFSSILKKNQLKLLDSLIDGKTNFIIRLRLTFASSFIRQRWIDTLILRVLFLIGRF